MTLADFTKPGLIVPHLHGRDATSVIHELSLALQREVIVPDLLPFYHAALNREFLLGTDLESGIACPHARLPAVTALTFAFGRSDEPFNWGPRQAQAVRLVFLLAVPATDSIHYLALISGLTRLAGDSQLVEAIRSTPDTGRILELFALIGLRAGSTAEPLVPAVERGEGAAPSIFPIPQNIPPIT